MYSTYYGSRQDGYGYNADMFRFGFDHLDIVSSMLGWWSFSRRVLRRYTGPLFRARRSTDSAERDWYPFGPFGEVPIAAFQEWCSGGDAFAVTLYDQSGLARNFAQATTTIQPILAESGTAITENGRLAAKFVAADARRMSIASSTAMFNALHTTGGTVLVVAKSNDVSGSKAILANKAATDAAGLLINRGSLGQCSMFIGRRDVAGVATAGATASLTTAALAFTNLIYSLAVDPDNATAASRASLWINGALNAATNAETATPFVENAAGNMTLGALSSGAGPHDGTISEVALFSLLISTADRTAWQSRSGNFFAVTIS